MAREDEFTKLIFKCYLMLNITDNARPSLLLCLEVPFGCLCYPFDTAKLYINSTRNKQFDKLCAETDTILIIIKPLDVNQ